MGLYVHNLRILRRHWKVIGVTTDQRSNRWKCGCSALLGFDVADAGFWSGLSNCGYTTEELARLRPEWSKRINDFGLLQSGGDALTFREVSDRRVPEHAPFWVYSADSC